MATSPPLDISSPPSASPASTEIDGRRAEQLVERALSLAERGDLPAAILACRQSIALTPESSQSQSTLGLLLERFGDNAGAISAYEKVLQIAPDSFLERESLARLRVSAVKNRTTRDLFVFDDGELFADERPAEKPSKESKKKSSKTAPAELAAKGSTPLAATASAAVVAPSALDELASSVAAAVTPEPRKPARIVSAPVSSQAAIAADAVASVAPSVAEAATAARSTPAAASRTAMPFPSTITPPKPAQAPPIQAPMSVSAWPTKPATPWQKLRQRPSYYFRAAPLALTTVMSVSLLLWAHNFASSRALTETPLAGTNQIGRTSADSPLGSPNALNPGATTPGGAAANTPNAGATGSGTPTSPSGATTTPGAPNQPTLPTAPTRNGIPSNPSTVAPRVPSRPTAPTTVGGAPVSSGSSNNGGSANNDGGSTPSVPSPSTGSPSAPPASSGADGNIILPPIGATSGSSSAGGTSSSGAPRDYVRVTPIGTPRPTIRPENRATSDERAATASAREGDNSLAIARMSRAIENGGGDTAFRYQQRAQLYLQGGDPSRAINDFQTAIAAYNDMIGRSERVSFARSGIRASQRGIQLAQAMR